ncbi:MAG TPA: alpha/beta hydrolase [Bacteroidia bacterium]|jgi:hypothetical protein|nr:alpha/beta hydrolase [Bacteroidia bacterium]HMU18475.1 alpha/beta hydrolase [Bacteroidia bacterium]
MQYFSLILTISFLLSSTQSTAQHYVLYGERNLNDTILSVYFDRNGKPYPDYFIADSVLNFNTGSLDTFYHSSPNEFAAICSLYNCSFKKYSTSNTNILNDSIFQTIVVKINNQTKEGSVPTFMIHGFRKSYVNKPDVFTSVIDYNLLIGAINRLSIEKYSCIRVFWDGSYLDFSEGVKHMKQIFTVFENAQLNAVSVGYGLRQVLSRTTSPEVNIISHSLGAKVVTNALFDTTINNYPTPNNRNINICLIAPAIDGIEAFKNYYSRNSTLPYKKSDNYSLFVLYNKKDFVLRKKDYFFELFGPGPRKHGNTTLGCNSNNEAIKLKDYFIQHFPSSKITLINMTDLIEKCHHLRCYCEGDNLKTTIQLMNHTITNSKGNKILNK